MTNSTRAPAVLIEIDTISQQKKNIRILEVGAGTATPVATFFLWILMSLVFASFTVFLHNNALWQMTIECPLGERWGRVENKNLKAFRPRLDSPASGHGYNHTYNTNTRETVPLCKNMIRWSFCEDHGNLIFAHCMKITQFNKKNVAVAYVAKSVDHRWHLDDSLTTAFHSLAAVCCWVKAWS